MTIFSRIERQSKNPEHPPIMPSASAILCYLATVIAIIGGWKIHPGLGLIFLATAMFVTAALIREPKA